MPFFQGQEGRHDSGDSQREKKDSFETHLSDPYE
jgi:hypothetical protein